MTEDEAKMIVDELKAGKRFITRFQEQTWGISYLGNGRFELYASRMVEVRGANGGIDYQDETAYTPLDEKGVIDRFKLYRYKMIKARLRS